MHDKTHSPSKYSFYNILSLFSPVYATIPVHNMGSVALIEALHAKTHSQDFKLFNMHSIDAAFDKIHQLRFLQPVALGGRAAGITITAHAAGHTVGGTVWKIKKDTEDIVYAVDYNHKKERLDFDRERRRHFY